MALGGNRLQECAQQVCECERSVCGFPITTCRPSVALLPADPDHSSSSGRRRLADERPIAEQLKNHISQQRGRLLTRRDHIVQEIIELFGWTPRSLKDATIQRRHIFQNKSGPVRHWSANPPDFPGPLDALSCSCSLIWSSPSFGLFFFFLMTFSK